jgi:hypothetical protein
MGSKRPCTTGSSTGCKDRSRGELDQSDLSGSSQLQNQLLKSVQPRELGEIVQNIDYPVVLHVTLVAIG